MYILGIETSCDETSSAVLKEDFSVLSNVVLSQDQIHSPYGGVVPELASRQHITAIDSVVDECLKRAKVKLQDIDIFGVTQGPGLVGSLLIGVSFAKGLAYYFQKPLVPVDHLESHIHAVFLENRSIPFPAIALLVSGGHTSLYLMEDRLELGLLGSTRDDAAGESLDKIAKYLGLGYPGGPVVDRRAKDGNSGRYSFTLPRMSDKSLDFSFSGLKTAAVRKIQDNSIGLEHPHLDDFLASFQAAVVKALLSNLDRAVTQHRPQTVILCGGVARNSKLRSDFQHLARKRGVKSVIPAPEFCSDNAAMVAGLALEKFKTGVDYTLPLDLNVYPSNMKKLSRIPKVASPKR